MAGALDGHRGEVQAGDRGPGAGEGQGVEAKVALQVHEPESGDIAQRVDLAWTGPGLVPQPRVHVVERRLQVDSGPIVPIGPIGGEVLMGEVLMFVVHADSVALTGWWSGNRKRPPQLRPSDSR